MKNITLILAIILLTSCGGGDKEKCLTNVKSLFPNSKIYTQVGHSFIFYVVDSTGVKKVTALNSTNDNVSGVEQLIEIK